MPGGPQNSQQQRSAKGAHLNLKSGKGEAAPARLLEQGPAQEAHDDNGQELDHKLHDRLASQPHECTREDECRREADHWNDYQREQVPAARDTPDPNAPEQPAPARASFLRAESHQRRQGRTERLQQYHQRRRQPQQSIEGQQHEPGNAVCRGEEGPERMAADQCSQSGGSG